MQAVLKNKKLVFYHAGAKSQGRLRSWVAETLGKVSAIVENYLAALDAEHGFQGLAWSLQPFDCDTWEASSRDDALSGPQMIEPPVNTSLRFHSASVQCVVIAGPMSWNRWPTSSV